MSSAEADHLIREEHLLAALRDDAKSETVNAMQWLGGCPAAMEAERRNGSGMVAVELGNASDRTRKSAETTITGSSV